MTGETPPGLVDEYYWLSRAGKLIEDAIEVKKATADRLVNAVAWLATAFVLFVTTLFATKIANPDNLVLGVSSCTAVVVIAAYLLSVHAAAPTYVEFDPRVPAQIEGAYARMATTTRTRLRLAMAATVAAALGVAASLVVLICSQSSAASGPQLNAKLDSGTQRTVVITGRAPKTSGTVVVTVIPDEGPTKSMPAQVDRQGDFTAAVPVAAAQSYRARVSWSSDDGALISIESAAT